VNILRTYTQAELSQPELIKFAFGSAVVYTNKSPAKDTPNEDSISLIGLDDKTAVFMIADGLGGQPSGDAASKIAVNTMEKSVSQNPDNANLRDAILDGFEKANQNIQNKTIGAATTLVAVEYQLGSIRPYHAGDSMVLVTGQRGKIKLQSVPHSPVGYAVESGLLDEDEAVHHEERHLVSNVVGSEEMRIEIGSTIRLAKHDTLIMSSDGLCDNLYIDEIIEITRKGKLENAAKRLLELARERMLNPQTGSPSHADDLSFILFRPHS